MGNVIAYVLGFIVLIIFILFVVGVFVLEHEESKKNKGRK